MPNTATRNQRNARPGRDELRIPVGSCPSCERSVLVARILDGEHLVDACIHCDHHLSRAEIDWKSPEEVVTMGYRIDGIEDEDCDTHGGCNDGTCGVRQPER